MSSDKKAKDSWKPSENGAVTFLLKPLTYEEVIKFSLYAEQYKNRLDKGKFNESQSSGPKKERVKWTHDLHSKFVNAIQELGPERCSGKNILKIMNEPGLTRTQVNSHLQKFRQWQKKSEGIQTHRPIATKEWVQVFGESSMLHPTNLKILLNL
ncbi:two-component response regulator ARR14-like [Apium graveolens]|uniref:two-component response regulator ARR14-like n=1 Tax=Apium graveolens TaxID=4045 RepID=UPI003D7B0379